MPHFFWIWINNIPDMDRCSFKIIYYMYHLYTETKSV